MIVCLSPHSDDAALSCGGLLALQAPAHVVTVFAGPAPAEQDLTPFARQLHRDWGDPVDPMAHRRREDSCALEVLGCAGTWWDYRDAVYRHPAYDSVEAIFGRSADEAALEDELRARCAALSGELLLFPLAVGRHVDHQLLFRVGWALHQAGRRVAFYEDLPYVAWQQGPQVRLQELAGRLVPQVVEITPSWPAKVAAISCYASQFAALTQDGVHLLEAVERYAAALVPGRHAERLWWPEEGGWI